MFELRGRTPTTEPPNHHNHSMPVQALHLPVVCGDITTVHIRSKTPAITEPELISSGRYQPIFTCGTATATNQLAGLANYIQSLHAGAFSHPYTEAGDWLCDGSCSETYAITKPVVFLPLDHALSLRVYRPFSTCMSRGLLLTLNR